MHDLLESTYLLLNNFLFNFNSMIYFELTKLSAQYSSKYKIPNNL